MIRSCVTVGALLFAASVTYAGPFNKGIGDAMYYGPYTGGHGYSPNVAYSYGLSFRAADSWRTDLLAYPGGITPYRPYERPILYRAWPKRDDLPPPYATPGPDGLPTLVRPVPVGTYSAPVAAPVAVAPAQAPMNLQPVPVPVVKTATIKLDVPAKAEVWFDAQKTTQTGAARAYETPALPEGKTVIYSVRARWTEDGKQVERYRVVGVRGGETAKINFLAERP